MNDNITREPYRNAWYKQLQEEISKVTPHLVPEVENDDNGKILVAGQEGTFGWTQPPEELPVITESDEGKVLKVDDGVPKWLVDSDSEYLVVNITKEDNVYSADKPYSVIREFALIGKCVVLFNKKEYTLTHYTDTQIDFECNADFTVKDLGQQDNMYFKYLTGFIRYEFEISEEVINYTTVVYYPYTTISVTNGNKINAEDYALIKDEGRKGFPFLIQYVNGGTRNFLKLISANNGRTEFDFENDTTKVHIASDRTATVSSKPVIPTPTSADEGKVLMVDANGDYTLGTVQGGSPHYAEVSLGISVE